MTGWSCRHEDEGTCRRVDGACCRPGMKGCVLVGKVVFQDGVVPAPVWPEGHARSAPRAEPGGPADGGEP